MPCYSPLKGWKSAENNGIVFKKPGTGNVQEMEVACGQCLGCRLDRARMWAMRINHEANLHRNDNGSCFITLTYRDKSACTPEQLQRGKHISDTRSLSKSDFQKFIKRLRKSMPGTKIKYYHAGEYGSVCEHGIDLSKAQCPLCNLGRPHYHAALFNVTFDDKVPYQTKNGRTYYTSKRLEDLWGYGHVDVGELNMQSAAYIARYVTKKITGENSKEHYQRITSEGEIQPLEPEYSTMSNGIGLEWYQRYKTDFIRNDECPVPGEGVFKKIPRYYMEKLKEEDEEKYEEIKKDREQFMLDNMHEYTSYRLMDKYKVKHASVNTMLNNRGTL